VHAECIHWTKQRRPSSAATDEAAFISTAWLRNAATLRDESEVLEAALLLHDPFAAALPVMIAACKHATGAVGQLHRDVCRAALETMPPRGQAAEFRSTRRAVEDWLAPLSGLPRLEVNTSRRMFAKRQLQLSGSHDEHLFWNHDQLLLAACRAQLVLRG
jgi:hypothetical protein